jgi:hypothetical protein
MYYAARDASIDQHCLLFSDIEHTYTQFQPTDLHHVMKPRNVLRNCHDKHNYSSTSICIATCIPY